MVREKEKNTEKETERVRERDMENARVQMNRRKG